MKEEQRQLRREREKRKEERDEMKLDEMGTKGMERFKKTPPEAPWPGRSNGRVQAAGLELSSDSLLCLL